MWADLAQAARREDLRCIREDLGYMCMHMHMCMYNMCIYNMCMCMSASEARGGVMRGGGGRNLVTVDPHGGRRAKRRAVAHGNTLGSLTTT